jgi:hypothetical protein
MLMNRLLLSPVVSGGGGPASRCLSYAGCRVPPTTQNVIHGQWLESSTDRWIDVHNPATNEVVTRWELN